MSIKQTLVNEENSAVTQAVNTNSIAHISGEFEGSVQLQMSPAGEDNWLTILSVAKPMTTPLLTPDISVDYRFIVKLREGSTDVYFGA